MICITMECRKTRDYVYSIKKSLWNLAKLQNYVKPNNKKTGIYPIHRNNKNNEVHKYRSTIYKTNKKTDKILESDTKVKNNCQYLGNGVGSTR